MKLQANGLKKTEDIYKILLPSQAQNFIEL